MRVKGLIILILLLAVSVVQVKSIPMTDTNWWGIQPEESPLSDDLKSPEASPSATPAPAIPSDNDLSRSYEYTAEPQPVSTPQEPASDAPPSNQQGGALTRTDTFRKAEEPASKDKWYENKEKGLRVPILMYHNLKEGNSKGDGLNVSEKAFEDQLAALKAYGYNSITFEQLYHHYNEGISLPDNPVILTFDDGYSSNYTLGFPLLKKYEMKACIFMISDAIGSSNFMSKIQIKEVSDSGFIEIQSHSMTHDYELNSMNSTDMEKELSESKSVLEGITEKPVNVFCYPYGRYSTSLVDTLKKQGYIFSVTTEYGCASKKSHPLRLPRIRVCGEDTGKGLVIKVEDLAGKRKAPQAPTPTLQSTPEAAP